VTVSEDGRDSYGNRREAPNDDLVLALAIATYAATRQRRRARLTHVGPELPVGVRRALVPDAIIRDCIFR